ncbi:SIR2 family protein [Adlercreutzia sp. ZJ242]|uniref:SIR2 family protein n=1 Tax=Adlercreutzia sp. ZJ242 TaxID=2709409 RepID=UPI0013EE14BF|nr:SIR2 family protein [Adlercreutzia sp. ZJ242]
MDERIKDVIHQAVDDAGRYPFLFIGSGLSRRYCGTPGWEGLLSEVCAEVLDDPYAYARFKSQARIAVRNAEANSELPLIATLMEGEVNRVLFSADKFGGFRERHARELTGDASPMKIYVADKIANFIVADSSETEKLARAGKEKVAGIITTNYDCMCEALFPEFMTYVGESDLLFSDQTFSQEIYKIHGSILRADSIVLTSADYTEFAQKRKYLSAKLLTLFVEYPVVFLGYSIQDENIKSILSDICECLPDEKLERLSKRLIFVQHAKETAVGELAMSFGGRTLSMTKIATDDFESIYEAMRCSRKMYSTRFIRELRGSVFRLAERIDPASDIVVSGIDNVLNDLSPDQKIVIGLSVSPANIGRPISPEDIFEDVVLDNLHYDPKFIVENYLNMYVRQRPNSMPVFKYTCGLNGEVGKDIAAYLPTLASVDSYRSKTTRKSMPSTRRRFEGFLSIKGLEKACAPNSPFAFIPCLEEHEIDVDDLEGLLKQALVDVESDQDKKKVLLKNSNFRKCIRIYDFLRYGDRKSPSLHQ